MAVFSPSPVATETSCAQECLSTLLPVVLTVTTATATALPAHLPCDGRRSYLQPVECFSAFRKDPLTHHMNSYIYGQGTRPAKLDIIQQS